MRRRKSSAAVGAVDLSGCVRSSRRLKAPRVLAYTSVGEMAEDELSPSSGHRRAASMKAPLLLCMSA